MRLVGPLLEAEEAHQQVGDAEGSFKTHWKYLGAIASLASQGKNSLIEAYEAICQQTRSAGFLPERVPASRIDNEQVRTSLENAWGTELLLALGKQFVKDDEVIRLSNNWSVVQVYYMLYHATHAIVLARQQPRPDSHAKTHNLYVDFFVNRSTGIVPWSLAASTAGYLHVPQGLTVNTEIHQWSTGDDATPLNLTCKVLRTTREEAVKNRMSEKRTQIRMNNKREWIVEEKSRIASGRTPRRPPRFPKPRLNEEEKIEVERKTRPYGCIDYLYRLRRKANYEDAAMFVEGPDAVGPSEDVRESLCLLAGTTMLLSELCIATMLEPGTYREWANRWAEANTPKDMRGGLIERIPFTCGV